MKIKELNVFYRPASESTIHKPNMPLFSNIAIQDSVETLTIKYKGKEYKLDLEKVLELLCKEALK